MKVTKVKKEKSKFFLLNFILSFMGQASSSRSNIVVIIDRLETAVLQYFGTLHACCHP